MVEEQTQKKQAQEYDSRLKVLFGNEAGQILPRLVPGTRLLGEQNIEIDRSQLKADLVYTVMYRGRRHILNVELQTKADKQMHYRLLQYHVGLHAKYKSQYYRSYCIPLPELCPGRPIESGVVMAYC